ncbi:MAG TPA: nucleotidyltransferase domain-containing protein [Methylomirabilota bacterium]|nr:nucleotidyltransferase domain-containing protein [Methylomirabilota bacterium]
MSVYLFGSQAEARAHRESDLDLGILFHRDVHRTRKERFEAALRLAADLSADLGIGAVDLVVLNDAPPLLGRRVVTEGQRLVCRNSEADHAYVRDVQLRAADLLPFLERMRKIKLEALSPR